MTPGSVFLHDFHSQLPPHQSGQGAVLDWIAAAHGRAETLLRQPATAGEREALERRARKLVLRFGCATDRISTRNSYLDDFTHADRDRMRIFPLDRVPNGAPCGERSRFFGEVCDGIFEGFFAEDSEPPPVLVHVTCTGYVAPSGAQRLVAARDWGRSTEVVHAYHMGCYASLPAIRMAAGFLARGKARVELVHTELCSLHLDPTRHLPEDLVAQTLFADGAIRYAASPVPLPGALELVAAREEIVAGTEEAITWMVSDFGMEMTLSRRVPDLIRAELGAFLERLGAEAGFTRAELTGGALFAIHPGGPRIIDELAAHLGLAEEQVRASNGILRDHGNMSSATLPHVWQAILKDGKVRPGTPIVALAFGPGLTISGAILRTCP